MRTIQEGVQITIQGHPHRSVHFMRLQTARQGKKNGLRSPLIDAGLWLKDYVPEQ